MLSSPLFREGDTVTPCALSTRRIHMLYDPTICCGYDDCCRSRHYDTHACIRVQQIGHSVKYYTIDIDTVGYSWTDEAFREAQPIVRYLNWKENEY
jgi:hypothetical protein